MTAEPQIGSVPASSPSSQTHLPLRRHLPLAFLAIGGAITAAWTGLLGYGLFALVHFALEHTAAGVGTLLLLGFLFIGVCAAHYFILASRSDIVESRRKIKSASFVASPGLAAQATASHPRGSFSASARYLTSNAAVHSLTGVSGATVSPPVDGDALAGAGEDLPDLPRRLECESVEFRRNRTAFRRFLLGRQQASREPRQVGSAE